MQSLILILIVVGQASQIPALFEKAREHKCSGKEKISCNGPIGSCGCDDGSKCIFTNLGSVKGCPCKNKTEYDYSFIEKAKEHGCNDDKFECNASICNCSCLDGSTCLWSGDKIITGCPCKVKKDWGPEPTPVMSRDELKQRRIQRDLLKKERDQDINIEAKNIKKQRVLIEDI